MTVDGLIAGQGLAVGVAVAAAIADIRHGTIPDWLTLPPIFIAVAGYLALGGLSAAGISLGAAGLTAAIPFLMQRAGAMSGGDVKAFAAIGALLGPGPGLEAEVLALIAALVIAVTRLARAGELRPATRRALGLLLRRPAPEEAPPLREVKLGPALAFGTIVAVALVHL